MEVGARKEIGSRVSDNQAEVLGLRRVAVQMTGLITGLVEIGVLIIADLSSGLSVIQVVAMIPTDGKTGASTRQSAILCKELRDRNLGIDPCLGVEEEEEIQAGIFLLGTQMMSHQLIHPTQPDEMGLNPRQRTKLLCCQRQQRRQ